MMMKWHGVGLYSILNNQKSHLLRCIGVSSCHGALQLMRNSGNIDVVIVDKGIAKRERGFNEQETHGSTGGLAFIQDLNDEFPYVRTILMSGEENLKKIAEASGVWGVSKKPSDFKKLSCACALGMLNPREQQQHIGVTNLY